MTRESIEVTRQDRIYCLKASSDYHSEVCEECKFYTVCDHMTQDDMAELTIKDLEALEQEPCEDAISRQAVLDSLHSKFADGFDSDRWWNSMSVLYAINKVPPVNPTKPKVRDKE